jgi:hypothetical protein
MKTACLLNQMILVDPTGTTHVKSFLLGLLKSRSLAASLLLHSFMVRASHVKKRAFGECQMFETGPGHLLTGLFRLIDQADTGLVAIWRRRAGRHEQR